eukprot:TRINITY_DN518_c0_g1_i5.p4 TRINITY_DN518_c0_g1~~TRINITY_DN518_c0_g1_i5.p4  ORF type:complete len:112 (+),score=6.99 TRINITY_DN518_c0_g1_i5:876-1211(+)
MQADFVTVHPAVQDHLDQSVLHNLELVLAERQLVFFVALAGGPCGERPESPVQRRRVLGVLGVTLSQVLAHLHPLGVRPLRSLPLPFDVCGCDLGRPFPPRPLARSWSSSS